MIKVFHFASLTDSAHFAAFSAKTDSILQCLQDKSAEYKHVANVDVVGLEGAFTLTNTIDFGWWENLHVEPTFNRRQKGCRSTSVGDIMVKDDVIFLVDTFGFRDVTTLGFQQYLKNHD